MASGPYRLLAIRLGNAQQTALAATLFRNFINATATLTVAEDAIRVRF